MAELLMKNEPKLDPGLLDSKFIAKAVVKLMKHDISARYKQTGEVTDEDWEFCEKIDWHPVDELPYKEEFVKRVLEAEKRAPVRFKSVEEIFK